ncbi:MAG: glycosyltransferase family 39 protein [Vicinamibacterales bacterium]
MAGNRALLGAAAAGLVLRLAFGLVYWVGEPLTRDEQEYLSLARSLAAGHGFVYDEALRSGPIDPFDRAPGYPAFLAIVGAGRAPTNDVPTAVKAAQAVVGLGGVLLVGLIAGQLAGARAAAVAAGIAAVYPPLVAVSARAFSEALFWPMGLAAAALLSRADRTPAPGATMTAALAGVVAGAATLVRPGTIVFVALGGLWLIVRRRPARALALALGAAVVIGPWIVRDSRAEGRVVIVASEGGVNFWAGNHPLAVGDGDLAANPDLKRASVALKAAHPDLTEAQMEPVYYREALAWMRAHPIDWLALEGRKLFFFVAPVGPSYRLHSWRYTVASAGPYLLVLPLAVAGAWRLGAARSRAAGLWLLAASALVTALIFFPQERYRLSVVDPVLIVCAGAAWGRGPEAAGPA